VRWQHAGPFPIGRAVRLVSQLLEALASAKQAVTHLLCSEKPWTMASAFPPRRAYGDKDMTPAPVPDPADFARLLAEARAGSIQALGQLWQEHRKYLLLVANQKLDSDLQAKVSPSDLVQDTFLEAQHDFAQFHGRSEKELRAWLGCILVNNVANVTRHYRDTDKAAVDREVPLPGPHDSAPREQELCGNTPTPSDRVVAAEDLAPAPGLSRSGRRADISRSTPCLPRFPILETDSSTD
jgi:DNA-directed RNA polymerase specialized sigma24 family protein